jgi:hypothetical protein
MNFFRAASIPLQANGGSGHGGSKSLVAKTRKLMENRDLSNYEEFVTIAAPR